MFKFVLICLLVAAAACQAAENSWYGKHEAACVGQGGLCITASECTRPVGRAGELCPQQAAQGFQCCNGLPKDEKRCRMHGGQCFDKGYHCNQRVVYSEANDCGADQHCCILL